MIRDWIVANKPPNAAKRLSVQLNACCKWGMKSGLITENPFSDMASEIKLPKNQRGEENDITPFLLSILKYPFALSEGLRP